jgi:hypothetical protein
MNEKPRQTWCDLITQDRTLCTDARRLRGLLNDYCGIYRKEVRALVEAVTERVPQDLQTGHAVPLTVIRAQLVLRLHEHIGLDRQLAEWAVISWEMALGITSYANISPSPPSPAPAPAPPPAPAPTPPTRCPECGAVNDTSELYCQQCAHQLQSNQTCRHCGYRGVPCNAKFCPRCGTSL